MQTPMLAQTCQAGAIILRSLLLHNLEPLEEKGNLGDSGKPAAPNWGKCCIQSDIAVSLCGRYSMYAAPNDALVLCN